MTCRLCRGKDLGLAEYVFSLLAECRACFWGVEPFSHGLLKNVLN
jgi:hypothetical protein